MPFTFKNFTFVKVSGKVILKMHVRHQHVFLQQTLNVKSVSKASVRPVISFALALGFS